MYVRTTSVSFSLARPSAFQAHDYNNYIYAFSTQFRGAAPVLHASRPTIWLIIAEQFDFGKLDFSVERKSDLQIARITLKYMQAAAMAWLE
jgi:hypothetical protein